MKHRVLCAVAPVVLTATCLPASGDVPLFSDVQAIAYSGQPIPALSGQVYESVFNYFSMSPGGSVSFRSRRQSPGNDDVFIGRIDANKQMTLIADSFWRPVAGAPMGEGGDYILNASNADHVTSFSSQNAGFGNFNIVNAGDPAAPSVIARVGSPVTGMPGATFSGAFRNLFQGPGGTVTFMGDSTGSVTGRSLWTWSPGVGLQPALSTSQPINASTSLAPDFTATQPYLVAGRNGFLASIVSLSGPGVISNNNDLAVVHGTPGAMSIVARRNDPISLGSTYRWSSPSLGSVSASGSMLFTDQPKVFSGPSFAGLWMVAPGGEPQLIVTSGPLPPGSGTSGLTLRRFVSSTMNANGQLACIVAVNSGGSDRTGIIAGTPGNLRTIAMQGSQISNMPTGTLLKPNFTIPPIHLSESGLIAFTCGFTDPALPGVTPTGLWVSDLLGDLQLVARAGSLLEVAPGDLRTVSDLFLPRNAGANDASAEAWSDSGLLTFQAQFTDGSYALFTTMVVPAPGSTGVVAYVWLASAYRRRRSAQTANS